MVDNLIAFAKVNGDFFVICHLLALVFGLGGATYSDILLLQFLQDLKIDKKEAGIIQTMSALVFFGVFLAFVSGFFLFLSDIDRLLGSDKFLAKVFIFCIIMLNGFLLHRMILPRLIHFSFKKDHFLFAKTLHLRHAGFIMGAVSAVSWYSVFILGGLPFVSLSFWKILSLYFIVLFFTVSFALLIERKIKKRQKNRKVSL